MFHFLETNVREKKKNENRIQTSVDNTVNDLGYENKFENRVKDKNNFLLNETLLFFFLKKKTYIFYFWRRISLKISKNLIGSAFFCRRRY